MEKQYIIGEQLANALLNYLADKPIREADQLFHSLQAIKPFEQPVPEEPNE